MNALKILKLEKSVLPLMRRGKTDFSSCMVIVIMYGFWDSQMTTPSSPILWLITRKSLDRTFLKTPYQCFMWYPTKFVLNTEDEIRVDTLTRSECIIVIIYGWYQSFILISWWGYQCFGFFNQKMWDWMTSKTRPRFHILARAAGGCPPPKAIPDREPTARRIFFEFWCFQYKN